MIQGRETGIDWSLVEPGMWALDGFWFESAKQIERTTEMRVYWVPGRHSSFCAKSKIVLVADTRPELVAAAKSIVARRRELVKDAQKVLGEIHRKKQAAIAEVSAPFHEQQVAYGVGFYTDLFEAYVDAGCVPSLDDHEEVIRQRASGMGGRSYIY